MASMRAALLQKNKISMSLLRQHPEIVGIGIGYADPQRPDRGGALIVYTHKNIVTAEVNRGLARVLETRMPTRIIQSGLPRPKPAVTVKKRVQLKGRMARQKRKAIPRQVIVPQQRHRPVPGGVSIGHLNTPTSSSLGTGGLVTLRNNQYFLLTNNHVAIQNNTTAPNMYQPGPFEGGAAFNPSDLIGRAALYVPLSTTQVNFMDAAIIGGIPNDDIFNPRYLRPFLTTSGIRWIPIALPGHLNSVPVGLAVYKTGRTSGFTTGTVESINVDQRVGPYPDLGGATILFRGQVIIRGASQPGDSGSVWLASQGNWAAALNFAGGEGTAVATPIATVMNTFQMLVAAPGSIGGKLRAGKINQNRVKGDYSYSLPLTENQRKLIRVVRRK